MGLHNEYLKTDKFVQVYGAIRFVTGEIALERRRTPKQTGSVENSRIFEIFREKIEFL